jgi:hypothetical protein
MAAIKSYTDLEQSKKLAEFLPIESADGGWYGTTNQKAPNTTFWLGTKYSKNAVYPAWSLAALLSIIPNYKLSSEHNYHTCIAETSFGKETVTWFDNSIDACVVMIEKLHELNFL